LNVDKELEGKLKKSKDLNRKTLSPMHVRRQNFGCTCLKNNPDLKQNSLE